jgi:KDO2-lipid IV(A) lauroyltransferase
MGLGQLAYFLQSKRARIGYLNLKAAFGERLSPDEARRIARRVFGQLGAGLMEMLRLPAIDGAYLDRYIDVVGQAHVDNAINAGRPVVLLTGHFGNWELCSIATALRGHPIVALARAQDKLPKLYRLLVSYRESKGCRIIHKGGAMRQLLQALERREPVGIVGDQASRQGIFVEFFGRPALFTTGPFELARTSGAVIVPGFIHRVRGPFHRIVVEPAITLPRTQDANSAIRAGIEQFAKLLARHIEQDPTQWLWVHKRWKHTPQRRVLVLSDGKLGHLKQSMTVLQAFKEQVAGVNPAPQLETRESVWGGVKDQVVEVRYRHRLGRVLALVWAWLMPRGIGGLTCLRGALEPACFRKLASSYADLIISCGASTAPVNVLLSADNLAKSVVIMNPTPIPIRKFSLAFVPVHDHVPRRANMVCTFGALTTVSNGELAEARERLRTHPRFRAFSPTQQDRPVVAVFLGGDTPEYQLTSSFTEALLRQVLAVCEERDGVCLVTTSRRTPSEVERLVADRLEKHPRCRLLLLASRHQLDGTVEGMLGWAHVVVVTGESISMVSEAAASGKYVIVVEPPLKRASRGGVSKPKRFLHALVEQRYIKHHPLPEVAHAIRRCLSDRPSVRRLDAYATVQEAVKRLL